MAGSKEHEGCPEEQAAADTVVVRDVPQETIDRVAIIFNNLMFATDKATIDPSSHDDLDELIEIMKDDSDLNLRLEGHTDHRGTEEYNMNLSRDRVNAVKQYLVDGGISNSRITTRAYGETRPLVSGETQHAQDMNRRVEFELTYN